eukprot:scaffold641862_cov32-Prasinocladus_malaysianus.AAC.1
MEPRYSVMRAEEEAMRESNREAGWQFHKAMEAPFSFYYTDKLRMETKKEAIKKAKDPNRFQKKF